MEHKLYTMDFAGKPLTLEFGRYCEQANGSVWVHHGDTVVMVNATMAPAPREGVDFFPLAVDVEEKQYSVGKIPGGFIKREGRPSEKATLTCRLIDRPLRPLFDKGMRNDVQVVVTILSVEQDCPPEIPAMIGSSVALAVSDIPWNGPTDAVQVGRVDGKFVICPNEEQRAQSDLSLYVAGTEEAIMMVEAGAKELSEDTMLDAILFGHEEIKKLVAFQKAIVAEIGKEKKVVPLITTGDDIKAAVREFAYDKCVWTFETFDRKERQDREAQTKEETLAALAVRFPERESAIEDALYYLNKEVMRAKILNEGIRPDGRKVTEKALKGKVNVVTTWATWSMVSINQQERLKQLKQQYGDQLGVLSICLDAQADICRRTIARDSLKWPTVCDGRMWESPLLQKFAFADVPANLLIDSKGRVLSRNLSVQHLDERIKKLLK